MKIIAAWLTKIWNAGEIRVLILLNMVMQIFLIFLATHHKYSASRLLSLALWSFYLLADYVAALAFGNLLSTLNSDNHSFNVELLAFWALFLLLHLGRPNTITAYFTEDNELWWRHLLGLMLQVTTAVAVLIMSLLSTRLWRAALPVYLAGILMYGERKWSRRSASVECLVDSLVPPDAGPSYAKFMEEYAS